MLNALDRRWGSVESCTARSYCYCTYAYSCNVCEWGGLLRVPSGLLFGAIFSLSTLDDILNSVVLLLICCLLLIVLIAFTHLFHCVSIELPV
jgi:hypothetical protein